VPATSSDTAGDHAPGGDAIGDAATPSAEITATGAAGARAVDDGPARRDLATAAVVTLVAFLIGGVIAAALWDVIADPPYSVVKGNNAYQDAAQLARQFGIDVSFGAACLLVTVPLGAAVGLRWQRLGWPIVVVLVVAAALASGIAWQLGATFGAADPSTLIDTAADGDRLYAPLELQARGVLVSAPVGALVGFIAAMVIRPTHPADPPRSQLDRTASRSGART
jgi:hypothetical protein